MKADAKDNSGNIDKEELCILLKATVLLCDKLFEHDYSMKTFKGAIPNPKTCMSGERTSSDIGNYLTENIIASAGLDGNGQIGCKEFMELFDRNDGWRRRWHH